MGRERKMKPDVVGRLFQRKDTSRLPFPFLLCFLVAISYEAAQLTHAELIQRGVRTSSSTRQDCESERETDEGREWVADRRGPSSSYVPELRV
jgi:hypothetical protein